MEAANVTTIPGSVLNPFLMCRPLQPHRLIAGGEGEGFSDAPCVAGVKLYMPCAPLELIVCGSCQWTMSRGGGEGAVDKSLFRVCTLRPPPPPRVTFRRVVVSLRGPGQSPVLPFACCVGSLRSDGRCGRCSCWCRFRGAQSLVCWGCAECGGMCRLRVSGAQ